LDRLRVILILLASVFPLRTMAEPREWYVGGKGEGDGSVSAPFASLASVEAASAEGDAIHLLQAPDAYPGGLRLKRGQSLSGDGGRPVIAGTVVLAPSTKLRSLTIRAANAAAIRAMDDASADIRDVDVQLNGGDGLVLTSTTGAIEWTGGGITGTGTALRVSGGSGHLKLHAPIDVTDAIAVIVKETAMSIALDSVSDRAVSKRMDQAVVVEKSSAGFSIAGGTIEKMQARAISITDSAQLSLSGMLLRENAANGVAASFCGGDSGDGVGCNAAIYLRNVRGVVIDNVRVSGTAQVGINGVDVDALHLTNVTVEHAGNEDAEHAIQFRNLTGEASLSHVTVRDAASRALSIENERGAVNLRISDSSFSDSSAKTGSDGVRIAGRGDAHIDALVRKCEFGRDRGSAVDVFALGKSEVIAAVEECTIANSGAAISLLQKDQAVLRFRVERNVATGSRGAAISVVTARPSDGIAEGTIVSNTIGKAGVANSGAVCGTCTGIALRATGGGRLTAVVHGNTVMQVDGYGIAAVAADGAPVVEATITGNRILEPAGSDALNAIHVQSGASASDRATVCATIGGEGALANTITGSWPAGSVALEHQYSNSAFRIGSFSGDGTKAQEVAAFVSRMNGRAQVEPMLAAPPETVAFTGGDPCRRP
jgi:hypothetical protein